MTLPWASALDVEYVGQHSYNSLEAWTSTPSTSAPRSCRRTRTRRSSPTRPPARGRGAGSDAGLPRLRRDHAAVGPRLADVPLAAAVVQPPVQGRPVVRVQRHDRPLAIIRAPARGCSTTPTARTALAQRSGGGGRAARNRHRQPPHLQGQLRVGPAGHPVRAAPRSRRWGCSSTTGSSRASGPVPRAAPTPSASATRAAGAT